LDRIIVVQSEFGIGIIAATQLAFSTVFNANAAYKVLFKLGEGNLIKRQGTALGLNGLQIQWALSNLGGQGNAIISTPDYNEPHLIALNPLAQPLREYTQEDLEQSAQQLIDKIHEYAKPQSNKQKKPNKEASMKNNTEQDVLPGQLSLFQNNTTTGMFPNATKLLKTIAPKLMPIARAYKEAGLSASQGQTANTFLKEQDLATSEQCRLYKGRGRQPVIMEPTAKGLDYLKSHHPDVKLVQLKGRGSLQHRIHVEFLAAYYATHGYFVRKEHRDADLGVEDPQAGTWLAIEVVTKNEDNLEHRVQRNKEAGATKTIVVCSSPKTTKRVAELLGDLAEVQDIELYLREREREEA
jgi:hypothetical protein